MFQKIKNEFNQDFILTSKFEKVCMIFGCLTSTIVMSYICIKLVALGASGVYDFLKAFGFFTI